MKKKYRGNYVLILFAFLTANIFYCQTSQILIETQLNRYGPDLKSNFYNLSITSTGAGSFSKAYDLNQNDGDDTKYFYDLVSFDASNFPLNCIINSYYKVQPTQIGGVECNRTDNHIINSQKDANIVSCHGATRLFFLDLPIPQQPVGNCDIISIEKKIQLASAGYSWQYKKSSDADWSYFEYDKHYTSNGLNFSPNDIPSLLNFTGNLLIRFVVDYENLKTSKIESYLSNTILYAITTCSPALDGEPLIGEVKCNNAPTGSVTLKFKTELKTGYKFLFNLFSVRPAPEDPAFLNHVTVLKDDIINNTFTWNNLTPGSYIIKYQAQGPSENETETGSTAISKSFKIKNIDPLTFSIEEIQPKCITDNGSIIITAQGGTAPYYYVLDNETETIDGKVVDKKNPFTSTETIIEIVTEGKHKVKVIDSNECIEKQ